MRKVALGLALSGVIASQAHAVGLGEIRTHSSLNQPLSANIELVETTSGDIDDIQVSLAPSSVFEQVGINRSQLLDQLEFIPTIENGVPTIKVVSLQPIQEPFLNFVLEVTWASGKLLREYTVLLDPPVFSDTQYAGSPAVAQPVAELPIVESLPEAVTETVVPEELLAPLPEVAVVAPVLTETEMFAGSVGGLDPFVSVPEAAPVGAVSEAEAFMYEGLQTYPVEDIAGLPEPVVVSEAEIAAELNQPLPEGIDPFMPAGALPAPEMLAYETGSEPRYEDYAVEETYSLAEEAVEFVDPSDGTDQVFVAESILTPAEAEIESIFVEPPAAVAAAPSRSYGDETYRVAKGDSLSRIAAKVGVPGALNKTMIALLQENPEAFINSNMNLVRAGYILRVPDAETINGISEREALSMIASQNSAWKEYRNQVASVATPQFDRSGFAGIADLEDRVAASITAEEVAEGADVTQSADVVAGEAGVEDLVKLPTDLEILVPEGEGDSIEGSDNTGTGAIGNLERELSLAKEQVESQTQQNAELRSRVSELESLLESKNRLIELKNEQLAEFQVQLDEAPAKAAAERAAEESAAMATSAAEAVKDTAKGLLPKTGVEQESPASEPAESKAASESTTSIKDPVPEAKPKKAEEPSMLDGLKDNPNLMMGAGFGGLLLAALGWLMLRRKDDDEAAENYTNTVVTTAPAPEPVLKDEVSDDAENAVAAASLDEQSLFDPEAANSAVDELEQDLEDVEVDREELLEGTGVDLDDDSSDDEVMSEANVYLAYGLQDQAIDLLQPVVEASPERTDYAVKLAEAYHSTGDKESFETLATNLKGRIGDTSNNEEWSKVALWGKDLLPDNALFAGTDTSGLSFTEVGTKAPELDVPDLGDSLGDISDDLVSEPEGVADVLVEESLSLDIDDLTIDSPDQVGEIDLKELDDLDIEFNDDDLLENDLVSAELTSSDDLSIDDLSMEEADSVLMTSEIDQLGASLGLSESSVQEIDLDDDLNLDTLVGDDESLTVFSAGEDEVSTKLDLAKAYLDMGDDEGAREALDEVINMGSEDQRNEATKLKSQLDA